jgi:uncharacterized protein (DUF433 family)
VSYRDIITIEPDKRGGKPCIRGLRITVYDVLEYLASGMTPAEILEEFEYLAMEDIQRLSKNLLLIFKKNLIWIRPLAGLIRLSAG